jgi:tetratricopeptide (TPR) repeat protein
MRDLKPRALVEYARREELSIATSRLLSYVFSDDPDRFMNAGRYTFLYGAIEKSPQLLDALVTGLKDPAIVLWSQAVEAGGNNVQFCHGLAVLYHEQAVERFNKGDPDERLWLLSTALWLRLLCSGEFWEYFSKARLTDRESNTRKDLDEAQQKALFNETWHSIMLLHNNYGRQDYASGRYAQAGIHVKCLDLCRKYETTIADTLSGFGMPLKIEKNKLSEGLMSEARGMAEDFLDDWGNTLAVEAEKIVDDPEAIKSLPEGIRKNYQGGIRYLQPFIDIGVPVRRALQRSLQWYCDWSYDLYTRGDMAGVKSLMDPSRKIADMLAPVCVKTSGHLPENQALSMHYMLRGFTGTDAGKIIHEYEAALEWNPGNDNAQQLLFEKQLDHAIEFAQRDQFNEAYAMLDSVEGQIEEKDHVCMARATVKFNHAKSLDKEGKFNKELYDAAISESEQIPETSRYYFQARKQRSDVYFSRGLGYTKRKQYDLATTDFERSVGLLRQALSGEISPNEKLVIEKELSDYLNQHAVVLIDLVYEALKKFSNVRDAIYSDVDAAQQSGAGYYGYSGNSYSCPVCGMGETRIVKKIISIIQNTGSFQTKSAEEFWRIFRPDLCYTCQDTLDSIPVNRNKAIRLLEEAVALDPGNNIIVDNLKAIGNL